jgi:hypothetical protein
MPEYHLDDWEIIFAGSFKQNQARFILNGYRLNDCKRITTSYIMSIENNKVTTYSGSLYILGYPSENMVYLILDYIPKFDMNNVQLIIDYYQKLFNINYG